MATVTGGGRVPDGRSAVEPPDSDPGVHGGIFVVYFKVLFSSYPESRNLLF